MTLQIFRTIASSNFSLYFRSPPALSDFLPSSLSSRPLVLTSSVLFSPVRIFPSVSLTRSLTPSRRPSLPHRSEPSNLQSRISSSLPASLNLPSLLNLSLPLSLPPPFSDFAFSFSNFLRSPQSSVFVFSVFVSSLHF